VTRPLVHCSEIVSTAQTCEALNPPPFKKGLSLVPYSGKTPPTPGRLSTNRRRREQYHTRTSPPPPPIHKNKKTEGQRHPPHAAWMDSFHGKLGRRGISPHTMAPTGVNHPTCVPRSWSTGMKNQCRRIPGRLTSKNFPPLYYFRVSH